MSRKPDTKTTMYQLLDVIREHIPFGLKEADMCQGICRGCSKKMMEMLDAEVSQWQADLDNDLADPTLADLVFMEKLARRTEKILRRNSLM
ncbi:hypothetical protein DEU29_1152 [Idiomarina aquatica]|uniref:Uncharacterized protein n=1 Tax=Idiomarina aquatica TaxID=1327752 RepID=A0A4R6P492_9GAMM|nr:hypothetical protein [Idiomarina aquatica]TDP30719.1 hypothetical protein DEU29_1152 [Idiomarina aquatica]